MEDYYIYILALLGIVVAFFIVKKVTSCLVKSIVLFVVAALLAYLYFMNR